MIKCLNVFDCMSEEGSRSLDILECFELESEAT